MDIKDIAWSAGLFEGEGYVGVSRPKDTTGKRYPRLFVRVNMCDKDVIEKMVRLWGGWSWTTERSNPNHRNAHVWEITYKKAREFLCTILVFLGDRRRGQIKEALKKENTPS